MLFQRFVLTFIVFLLLEEDLALLLSDHDLLIQLLVLKLDFVLKFFTLLDLLSEGASQLFLLAFAVREGTGCDDNMLIFLLVNYF